MASESNSDVLRRAGKHFNDPASREAYFDLYDERAVLHGYAGVEPGIASIKQFYAAFWAAFPDSQLLFEDIFEASDKLACRFVVEATHAGPFVGVPATGRRVTLPGITILRFENGKCVERWSQADFLGVMVQIGALPAPA
ncbi:MAG TPA: ester cyclase [Blastocatellia bacterium]|nr:ester cyclase [Blastocatellia bacterium]